MTRLETGTVQEGDDWPGVFIRGDNALMAYAPALSALIAGKASAVHMAYCDSLLRLLQSADVCVGENAVQRVTMNKSS
ncbi:MULTISPECIES: hypothetical protein [unclassified Phaeobacter]|uniref:hypothetical protein n=1 Tax=unclassified Phaeobacter TaxID=2621772 RepID=UPI003A8A52BE